MRADWIEHVLATRGEAYLRTPEEDLSPFVRLSLDVWAACLGSVALVIYATLKLARLACAKFDAALARSVALANNSTPSSSKKAV